MRTKLILWGPAAALALVSSAALSSVVVVKSLGPSAKAYPPGKTLPENARITLQGGDVVTVLGPNSAKTLRGPGNFDPKQVTLASAAGQRGRFGALRTGAIAHNPSIWDIDATQSGKVCIDPAKLQLWRPESDGAATIQIRSADGKSQPLTWAAGKSLATWPTALPITTGAQFEVEWTGSGDKSNVDVVIVHSPPGDLVGAAKLLIENGCQNQLDLLVAGASKAGD
jgi:hypothetical protein